MVDRQSGARVSGSSPWPGFFTVIEGIDGTGKSTLAHALGDALDRRGVPNLVTREPTDGPHGRQIREQALGNRDKFSPRQELDLFIADRIDHVKETLVPSLRDGMAVILDRYYYSTMAYQGARGLDPEAILQSHRSFAPEPDLLILLDLSVEKALRRIRRSRGEEPNDFEKADTLGKVAAIFAGLRHGNLHRFDAELAPDRLLEKALALIEPWIQSRSRS